MGTRELGFSGCGEEILSIYMVAKDFGSGLDMVRSEMECNVRSSDQVGLLKIGKIRPKTRPKIALGCKSRIEPSPKSKLSPVQPKKTGPGSGRADSLGCP